MARGEWNLEHPRKLVAPFSVSGGTIVEWSIIYGPISVSVRADNIFVRCPADFNHDSAIDFFDLLDFVDAFRAGC